MEPLTPPVSDSAEALNAQGIAILSNSPTVANIAPVAGGEWANCYPTGTVFKDTIPPTTEQTTPIAIVTPVPLNLSRSSLPISPQPTPPVSDFRPIAPAGPSTPPAVDASGWFNCYYPTGTTFVTPSSSQPTLPVQQLSATPLLSAQPIETIQSIATPTKIVVPHPTTPPVDGERIPHPTVPPGSESEDSTPSWPSAIPATPTTSRPSTPTSVLASARHTSRPTTPTNAFTPTVPPTTSPRPTTPTSTQIRSNTPMRNPRPTTPPMNDMDCTPRPTTPPTSPGSYVSNLFTSPIPPFPSATATATTTTTTTTTTSNPPRSSTPSPINTTITTTTTTTTTTTPSPTTVESSEVSPPETSPPMVAVRTTFQRFPSYLDKTPNVAVQPTVNIASLQGEIGVCEGCHVEPYHSPRLCGHKICDICKARTSCPACDAEARAANSDRPSTPTNLSIPYASATTSAALATPASIGTGAPEGVENVSALASLTPSLPTTHATPQTAHTTSQRAPTPLQLTPSMTPQTTLPIPQPIPTTLEAPEASSSTTTTTTTTTSTEPYPIAPSASTDSLASGLNNSSSSIKHDAVAGPSSVRPKTRTPSPILAATAQQRGKLLVEKWKICYLCGKNPKNMVANCGHCMCRECMMASEECKFCHTRITRGQTIVM